MSSDKILRDMEALREMPEGERWVWLAGRLADMETRLLVGDKRIAASADAVHTIQRTCDRRKWVVRAMVAVLTAWSVFAMWAIRNQLQLRSSSKERTVQSDN